MSAGGAMTGPRSVPAGRPLYRRSDVLLAGLVAASIALLAVSRIANAAPSPTLALQVVLLALFAILAVRDLRLAVAVAVLELMLGGASGRWTVLPAGLSGRMGIDLVLGLVALWRLGVAWRAGKGLRLGRYGAHALALALLIPAVWMPLGLLNGNRPADVLGDGDGYLFLGFALVLAAAALRSDLGWLRRWVLVGSLAVAVLHLVLVAAIVARLITAEALNQLVVHHLHFGGYISAHGGQGLRVYISSGLFLVVGSALVTWELLERPRRAWPWLAVGLLAVALLATSTRGYWFAAAMAAGIVVVLARPALRRRALLVGLAATAVLLVGAWLRVPLATFIVDRVASAAVGLPIVSDLEDRSAGGISNLVKLYQAIVLLGHIEERPWLGWGFGTIAPDYRIHDTYVYELTYLDRLYKTGIVGQLLFLTLPIRLVWDAIRGLRGERPMPLGMTAREAAVPLAILLSLLAVGATNPYLAGSVGLGVLVLSIAWLDPFGRPEPGTGRESGTRPRTGAS